MDAANAYFRAALSFIGQHRTKVRTAIVLAIVWRVVKGRRYVAS